MLEDLQVEDGMRVLEIGTGSGYSTGLLCHRLGSDKVTSIEVDPAVAARARDALHDAGYAPMLVVGDGLAGCRGTAPHDRVIATCSVRRLPSAWLDQTCPGGIILCTISGWLYGSGLARLEMARADTAEGRFLPQHVSFMIARPHAPHDISTDAILALVRRDGEERKTRLTPAVLDDWTSRFVAQLAAPSARLVRMSVDDGPMATHLIDDERQASATFVPTSEEGEFIVRQAGPARLWDDIEESVAAWRRAGAPGMDMFNIRATPTVQTVWLETGEGRLSWILP